VFLEDFWGGFCACSVVEPQLVLTLDEYAETLARRAFPKAEVAVVGNTGVPQPGFARSAEADFFFNKVLDVHTRIITFIGGGEKTGEELELLIGCLEKTPGIGVLCRVFTRNTQN
jgi:hypothetical protein